MWWTNWASERPFTRQEMKDLSDVKEHALELFKGRKLMYPCRELIDATELFMKNSQFDIRTLPSWHTSKVCLIGDAAHAVSPPSTRRLLSIGISQLRSRSFDGIRRHISSNPLNESH